MKTVLLSSVKGARCHSVLVFVVKASQCVHVPIQLHTSMGIPPAVHVLLAHSLLGHAEGRLEHGVHRVASGDQTPTADQNLPIGGGGRAHVPERALVGAARLNLLLLPGQLVQGELQDL